MPKIKRDYKIPISKTPYIRMTKNSNKEWEDVQCPICMETPHKAVLLICSSHDKGCRPFMCNSLVQYNCLAQYRTMSKGELSCPLCRGYITEERVVERACQFWDSKVRSCKYETCGFSGTREDLTWHWWIRHSAPKEPLEEEMRRRMEWATFEHEWELRDVIGFAIESVPPQEVDESGTRSNSGSMFEAFGETRIVPDDSSADGTGASTNSVPGATSAVGIEDRLQPRMRSNARMRVAVI